MMLLGEAVSGFCGVMLYFLGKMMLWWEAMQIMAGGYCGIHSGMLWRQTAVGCCGWTFVVRSYIGKLPCCAAVRSYGRRLWWEAEVVGCSWML